MSAATKQRKDLKIANEKLTQLVIALTLVGGNKVIIPEHVLLASGNYQVQVDANLEDRTVQVTLMPKIIIKSNGNTPRN